MLPSQLKNALVENWKFASQTSNFSLNFIIIVIEELLQEVMCFEDSMLLFFRILFCIDSAFLTVTGENTPSKWL